MNTLRTFAALAAACALPALAGPSFGYSYSLDTDDILADAQTASRDAEQWREYGERMREWAEQYSADLQGSLALTFSDRVGRGKVVKGAPYSAEVVSETNRTLADGNVISHAARGRVYRDAEGRTRQETYRNGELRSVYISDPVAGSTYTLIPGRKTAVKSSSATPRADRAPVAPTEVRVDRDKRVIVVDGDGKPGAHEEVHVRIVRGDDDKDLPAPPAPPLAPLPPVPPMPDWEFLPQAAPLPGTHSFHFEGTGQLGRGVITPLAAKDFDGVKAEGTQTTWTIPAGQIGNRAPINITRETWTSPELQVTLYSRYNDPRTGESIYRLASIKRGDPSPELFRIPEGYTVKSRTATPMPAPPAPPAPGGAAPAPAPAPPARG